MPLQVVKLQSKHHISIKTYTKTTLFTVQKVYIQYKEKLKSSDLLSSIISQIFIFTLYIL